MQDFQKLLRSKPLPYVIGMCAAVLFCVFAGTVYLPDHYGDSFVFFFFVTGVVLFLAHASMNFYFVLQKPGMFGRTSFKLFGIHICISTIGALILELGTLFGAHVASPFRPEDWSMIRIAIFFGFSFILCISYELLHGKDALENLKHRIKQLLATAITKKNVACTVSVVILNSISCYALSTHFRYSYYSLFVFFSCLSVSAALFFISWHSRELNPERLFLSIAFPVGLVFILAFPASNVYCWDDDVHYRCAESLSYLVNVERTPSDRMLINNLYVEDGFSAPAAFNRFPINPETVWSQQQIEKQYSELNENNNRTDIDIEYGISNDVLNIRSSIAHIPSAIGLWVGRLFHLPFVACYALGRFFNLLTYCTISFITIKIAPIKKILLSTLFLMPTVLFMASNYSYDPWIYVFCTLGIVLFIRAQLDKRYRTPRQYELSIAAMLIGMAPKAIYFPIYGIFLILIWSNNRKQWSPRVVLLAAAASVALLLSFVLPMIITGPSVSTGDLRGGSDVNSGEQIMFILNNPYGYAYTLLRFLVTTYLPVSSIEDAFTNLAYLGSLNALFPYLTGLVSIYLLSVAMLDSNKKSGEVISKANCIWVLSITAAVLVLICTSLYISFTAVGSDTIAGVQPRYLLPLVPLLFIYEFNFKIECRISQNKLSASIHVIDAVVLYVCLWIFLISRIFL